jgi:hypothetical protein
MCWVGKISKSCCKGTNTKAERCGLIAYQCGGIIAPGVPYTC